MEDELAELDQLLGSLVALQQNLRTNSPSPPPLPAISQPSSNPMNHSPLPLPPNFGEYDDSYQYCVDDMPFALPIISDPISHDAIMENSCCDFPPPPALPSPPMAQAPYLPALPILNDQQQMFPSPPPLSTSVTMNSPSFKTMTLESQFHKEVPHDAKKNVAASKELDSLLQELTVIEKEMREMEDGDGDFNRRYSLPPSSGKLHTDERGAFSTLPTLNDTTSLKSPCQLPTSHSNQQAVKILFPNHLNETTHQKSSSEMESSLSLKSAKSKLSTNNANEAEKPVENAPNSTQMQSNNSSRTAADPEVTMRTNGSDKPRGMTMHSISVDAHRRKADSMNYGPFSMHEMSDHRSNNCLKKVVVRVFHQDRTTKAVMVDESCSIRETCNVLIAKNYCCPNIKLALVEKVPSLKMEHCFEDHETLAECILSWPIDSQNMIFFEEREDKYGLFLKPQEWLGPSLLGPDILSDKHVKESIFGGIEPNMPEWNDFLYIKKALEKSWSRKYCLVRNSGLYASKRKKSTSPCDLIRIMLFDNNFHLYTTTGGWTKLKAPTPYGFALKPYSAQDPHSKVVYYFCASDEESFKTWITLIRIAKYGKQLLKNFECAKEDIERLQNEPPGLYSTTSGTMIRSSLSTRSSHPTVTHTLPRGTRSRNPRLANYGHDVKHAAHSSDGGATPYQSGGCVSQSPPRSRCGTSLRVRANTAQAVLTEGTSSLAQNTHLQSQSHRESVQSAISSQMTTFRPY